MEREICYILRKNEKHGRPELKDPWSLRQALVYQKYNRHTQTSVWIFIQLFKPCKAALWDKLVEQGCMRNSSKFHTTLLEMALADWRWFFNDSRRSIEEYVSASHSQI